MIMISNCNQNDQFSHNCAALINNYNGSLFLFYSDKLLLSLTGLSVRFDTKVDLLCSYIRSINLPSICVLFVLYFCVTAPPAGAHSLSELPLICQSDSSAVPQSDMQAE